MTFRTDQYHALTCDGRVENIISPVCGAVSPGKWHDKEVMEKEAEQLGWTRTARGHLCPTCSRAADAPDTPKVARKPRAKPEAAPSAADWTEQTS